MKQCFSEQRRQIIGLSGLVALSAFAPIGLAQSDLPLAAAINRSGFMRAMSQRLAKAYVQSALGIAPEIAKRAMVSARKSVAEAMGQLSLATNRDASLTQPFLMFSKSMDALLIATNSPARRADVFAINELADRTQEAADQMTSAFQAISQFPTAKVVNLAGRQRMLSQRMAKARFMTTMSSASQDLTIQLTDSKQEFADAFQVMLASPVTSTGIRRQLAAAMREAKRYNVTLDQAAGPQNLTSVASGSESILVTLDKLTSMYEAALRDVLG